ncbi:MAG: GIY-YIG nuclease family protein [Melioribacter sp.]|nr:GIY-YIG nuclease family protein [Melioribacter sp.]
MFYTYILYSPSFNRTYVEQTNNLSNRLEYHNSGKVKSTKAYKPWKIIYSESFESRAESMKREKWLKSTNGRKFIHILLIQQSETNGLSAPFQ